MRLVVGLGNPGRKYEGTRHNVGFEAAYDLARRICTSGGRTGFSGEYADGVIEGEKVVVLCPMTYMNRSGQSVVQARDFYKLENNQLLVLCDDFNLPLGKLRVRTKGSSGGQKGLEDIIRCLGTDEFCRLRIGIGPVPERIPAHDFVLQRFLKDEMDSIQIAVKQAADAAVEWVKQGPESCMNRYN